MMIQAIYISAETEKFTPEALKELLVQARENNQAKGISGLLVYHGGSFLQVLEGPEVEVENLLEKIHKDPRHNNIKILFKDTVPEKEFEDWSMGFDDAANIAQANEGFLDYQTDIAALTIDRTRAKRVLKMFQDGEWRQKVAT
ncbi:MAG: BLUF domain-containing protein [Rhodospirillales bacterium]